MPAKPKIPFRNRSPFGWWIYRELEVWTPSSRSKKKRCLVWENTRIIKARNRDEAYRKAIKLGKAGGSQKTQEGRWRFLGISDLLPVHEEIEDGAEILWNDLGYMTRSKAKRLVRSKRQLRVFDDKEE